MKLVGVSQKALILNKRNEILILRRSKSAPVRALTWDLPGGDLDFGEDAIQGIKREIKEETGLEVDKMIPFDVESHINREGDFWVTIAYKTKINSGKIVLSYEHDEFKWVSKEEFLKLDSADKLKRFVRNL